MASRMLRRSGVAVGLIAELLEWRADVIYQVGVGRYYEEMIVLREEWPGVEIIGCEPHPKLIEWAKTKKKKEENYPGSIIERAVSDEVGKAIFYTKNRHKDGSSLFPHRQREDDTYGEMEVAVSTLNALFSPSPKVRNMLWLDCEGNELKALQGGVKFLENIQVVNVELTSNPPGDGWCSPVEVHRFLVEHGFFRVWVHTQRSHEGQCDGIYVRRELFRPEFCCCPCEVERFNRLTTADMGLDYDYLENILGNVPMTWIPALVEILILRGHTFNVWRKEGAGMFIGSLEKKWELKGEK